MTKYLRHFFIIAAIVLFISALVSVNRNYQLASFILAACAIALSFVSVFTKSTSGEKSESVSQKGKQTLIERIKDPDSFLKIILKGTLFVSVGYSFVSVFEKPPDNNGLYYFLANSTGNIFAKILYGAITGAAFGAGAMLFFLLWFALIIAGIFLGFIVFGKKNKFLCILYGIISSVIALVTLITIINMILPSKQMSIFVQCGILVCAVGMGIVIGVKLDDLMKQQE